MLIFIISLAVLQGAQAWTLVNESPKPCAVEKVPPPSNATIKSNPQLDVAIAAENLEQALRSERGIIGQLINCSNAQRQKIRTSYKAKFGKDLVKELRMKLSGDLEELCVALMEKPAKYDAMELHRAMEGIGTSETILSDILCCRSPKEIEAIKYEYKNEYGKDLESVIVEETSGDYRKLLVSLLQGHRERSSYVNTTKAHQDAVELRRQGKAYLNDVFANQNFRQLAQLLAEFRCIYGYNINRKIKETFSGDAKYLYLQIVDYAKDKNLFFARELHKSMSGLGTRDEDLVRTIVSRSEIDLRDISSEFERLYNKPLFEWIQEDCSGEYGSGLIAIVNGNKF